MENKPEKIYKSKVVRQENGDISAMTEYRWQQQGFPKPIKINGQNYYTHTQRFKEIPNWIRERSKQS